MTCKEDLARQFAESVADQTRAIGRGDHRSDNRSAKRALRVFCQLRSLGDVGRDALLPLLRHERADVRITAAAFLLRHRTAEAQVVLEAEARGEGFSAFEARQALERWKEGTWALDPP
jgi:Domain of unknown function (DUF2019)